MRHRWAKAPAAWYCTRDVSRPDDATPFGIPCNGNGVVRCMERHGGPQFQVCGEVRCAKHKRRAATPPTERKP